MFYSLKSKMLLTFSLLLVVPFVTMVVILSEQSKNSIEQITKLSSSQTLEQYAGYLEMLGGRAEDIAFQILGNELTQQWIESRSGTRKLTQREQYALNAQVKDFISHVSLSHSNTASISLQDSNGFVIGIDSVYEHVQYESHDWHAYVNNHGPGWTGMHRDPYQPHHLSKQPVNSLIFPLVELKTLTIQGVIKINVLSSLIQQPLSNIELQEWSTIRLLDTQGNAVTNQVDMILEQSAYRMTWEQLLQSSKVKDVIQIKEEDGTVRYWFYQKLAINDWIILAEIEEKELFRSILATRQTMLTIGGLLLLLTIIAAYWISRGMTKPLSKLSLAMRKLEMGDFNVAENLELSHKGEAGYVLQGFSRMVNQLNQLIRDEFTLKLRKQDAEYKALLMQVNPHFLYNTLEIIGGLAAQNKTEQLIDVTESLGLMLRHSLKLDTDMIPLSVEMQQIHYYLMIIQARYEDEIQFEIHEDHNLSHFKIIKFIIQPLVENAVKYSREQDNQAVISISTKWEADQLVISVTDNGKGMSQELIDRIIQESTEQDVSRILGNTGRRVGLLNVLTRCHLYYDDRFKAIIQSEIGKGTKVSLYLPIEPML